ncbi:mRNA splicing factor [Niveomyces insectorum RCEF 264]|uniref:Pre-mRNA-splicing factor 18 n=1 Tax=Niveomyces insectorum RCEF 264 TaxID=1081102 RepID=A0A162JFG2_9HYPO|nr:mRNA splicing factor [Niveomyces insectorum RCEF 264]
MDFASFMSAQIAKKQKPTAASNDSTNGSASDSNGAAATAPATKKYMRIGEIEEQRKAAYHEAQKAREAEREAKAAAKRKREEEVAEEARLREEKRRRLAAESRKRREAREAEEERARRKRLGLPELPPTGNGADAQGKKKEGDGAAGADDDEDDNDEDMEEPVLQSALREHGAPAVLFGETHAQRLRRYRQVAAAAAASLTAAEAAKLPVPTTLVPVAEKDMKVPTVKDIPRDAKGRRYLFRQLASYFNLVLREWQRALVAATPSAEAETEASRGARSIMEQSRAAIRPLFRRLEEGDIEDKILAAIVEIVHAAQERRYVDANDAYLRLSIGKAAWPIGVIMVGIHERSAREKLHGGDKGGVMTDDVTRKYVQSIKRCLTFAQVRWPPDDASQLMG